MSAARNLPGASRRSGSAANRSRKELVKPIRLTTFGRFVLVLLLFLAVSTMIVSAAWVFGEDLAFAAPGEVQVTQVVVQEGETLWAFAASVREEDEDVRDVVAEIMRLNSLSSAQIHVGQLLILPER